VIEQAQNTHLNPILRYIVFEKCPSLADYCDDLVKTLAAFSYSLDANGGLNPPDPHPYQGPYEDFIRKAKEDMDVFKGRHVKNEFDSRKSDTWIFPSVQAGIFGLDEDTQSTLALLKACQEEKTLVRMTTGYFNPTLDTLGAVKDESKAEFDILMAHPSANGFLGSRFPSGGIPAAYTLIAKQFFQQIIQLGRIRLLEWQREGWTFHAKGLWLHDEKEDSPCLTMIGSPNFGYRSAKRDLECQFTLLTNDSKLKSELEEEEKRLFELGREVNERTFSEKDRRVPLWVKFIVWRFRNFF